MLPEKTPPNDLDITDLLNQIELGEIPLTLILQRLIEVIIKLNEKEKQLDSLIKSLPMLSDITKKISEIHTLHFPAKHLKKKSQKERFMAEILLGSVRKKK
ncbi:hypothetical protein [Mucilaginibacter flavus]|uniref:hypothetical protein n=1 Tax=Mucilaginibacter flavus TaxID=931504 RepID=UPI0025B3929A|nr:hypothetical protein [Mucilaginibacter flavus]MDN3580426.1 hypothetical protein [Mucilaginibacter flavus]